MRSVDKEHAMNTRGVLILAVIILFAIATRGYTGEDNATGPPEKKVRFIRYVTRLVFTPKENTTYIIEGIQHYREDSGHIEDMDITRMWIKGDSIGISFAESANVTPQGKIDFENVFVLYASGKGCIEKPVAQENLEAYKRGADSLCTLEELEKAKNLLEIGTKKAAEEIEKMRREEEGAKRPAAHTAFRTVASRELSPS